MLAPHIAPKVPDIREGALRKGKPLKVVHDRPGLRCRVKVSFEWYPDGTAHWTGSPIPRIMNSLVPRAQYQYITCPLTRTRYDIILSTIRAFPPASIPPFIPSLLPPFVSLRKSAFRVMMPATYDAGYHSFEFVSGF